MPRIDLEEIAQRRTSVAAAEAVGSKRYVIKSTIESTGLASFFSHTKAQTTVSGQFDRTGVKPDVYAVSYVYGEKSKRTGLPASNS